jgi:hypothetical protein
MQTIRVSILAAGVLTSWMLVAACGGTDATKVDSPANLPSASAPEVPTTPSSAPVADTTPVPTSTAEPPRAASVASTSEPDEPSERAAAPLVLKLQGPDTLPAKGDIALGLDIVAREPINGPVTLKVAVPKGATLATGKAQEVLQLAQAGTTHRDYVVRTTAALSGQVIVTADTKDAKGATGLHAERKYPRSLSKVGTTPGDKPPVPRPPGPPR